MDSPAHKGERLTLFRRLVSPAMRGFQVGDWLDPRAFQGSGKVGLVWGRLSAFLTVFYQVKTRTGIQVSHLLFFSVTNPIKLTNITTGKHAWRAIEEKVHPSILLPSIHALILPSFHLPVHHFILPYLCTLYSRHPFIDHIVNFYNFFYIYLNKINSFP